VLVAFTPHQGGRTLVWFTVALAAVVIWAHRKNIGRLVRGEEHRIGRRNVAETAAPRSGDGHA
jgi:glycerol-3-phosphate acyltransferase PlsY